MANALGKVIQKGSDVGWHVLDVVSRRRSPAKPVQPGWAPGALMKRGERSFPSLGFPRETDSLCPKCVIAERSEVTEGRKTATQLINDHVGEIKATLLEEDGKVIIRKTCPTHGTFDDILSIDPEFSRLQEQRFHGRDFRTEGDEGVHCHGASSIKYGRGSVLTIDLTNRCNMMCSPCYANANQVGYVHELGMDGIKRILDASISYKPRRQMSVQFSGGEPTMSPLFLDAIRYARSVGYYSTQAATNGIRFALEPEFAFQAREAGLCLVYFQLDGIGNEANRHRHVSNLFDVKLQAIENLSRAGIEIVPVATIINGVNNDQVGPLTQFVIDNCDKLYAISFQPISFTGRDESIDDAERARKRYTTSHLAHDLRNWSGGAIDPHRDWYPLGAGYAFTVLADLLRDPSEEFGSFSISCHPDCGSSIFLVANRKTGAWAPLTQFFDLERFVADVESVTDASTGPKLTAARTAASVMRNFDGAKAPEGLGIKQFAQMFRDRVEGKVEEGLLPHRGDWMILWVGGMWFQDLWTYDFRRTEMCCIPHGTEEGEISFCAYNTGIGWRQIVESIHGGVSTKEWHQTEGRHQIFAGDRPVDLPSTEHTVKVRSDYHSGNGRSNGT